jgi:hypothetical protein
MNSLYQWFFERQNLDFAENYPFGQKRIALMVLFFLTTSCGFVLLRICIGLLTLGMPATLLFAIATAIEVAMSVFAAAFFLGKLPKI